MKSFAIGFLVTSTPGFFMVLPLLAYHHKSLNWWERTWCWILFTAWTVSAGYVVSLI